MVLLGQKLQNSMNKHLGTKFKFNHSMGNKINTIENKNKRSTILSPVINKIRKSLLER